MNQFVAGLAVIGVIAVVLWLALRLISKHLPIVPEDQERPPQSRTSAAVLMRSTARRDPPLRADQQVTLRELTPWDFAATKQQGVWLVVQVASYAVYLRVTANGTGYYVERARDEVFKAGKRTGTLQLELLHISDPIEPIVGRFVTVPTKISNDGDYCVESAVGAVVQGGMVMRLDADGARRLGLQLRYAQTTVV